MIDWTDSIDQKNIACVADKIIDSIIKDLFESNIDIFKKHELNIFELSYLYRFPLYVATNNYFDKVIRAILHKNIIHESCCEGSHDVFLRHKYYDNTVSSVQAYYFDRKLNSEISLLICGIVQVSDVDVYRAGFIENHIKKTKNNIGYRVLIRRIINALYSRFENLYIVWRKPDIIGEYSQWFRQIHQFGKAFHFYRNKFNDDITNSNKDVREAIINISSNAFNHSIRELEFCISENEIDELSSLFGSYIDHIIPISLVEGLDERIKYYKELLSSWKIKQIHAFTGYYYNENFKIFSLLSKRKGAKFIGYEHGVNNYYNSYKRSNEVKFLDYLITYGINTDSYTHIPHSNNVKYVPIGSVDMVSIKKRKIYKKIYKNKLKILYAASPVSDYNADLEELSPEKTQLHHSELLKFIKIILDDNPLINVIYKPFPGYYAAGLVNKYLSEYISNGRVVVTNKKPKKLYSLVDMVIWDSISTGFAESLISGVPTLVFNSIHEIQRASQRGKYVNNAFIESGIQCLDIKSALNSFNYILNNIQEYDKTINIVKEMFLEDLALPITTKKWREKYNQAHIA